MCLEEKEKDLEEFDPHPDDFSGPAHRDKDLKRFVWRICVYLPGLMIPFEKCSDILEKR